MKVQNSILRLIIYGAVKHGANFQQLCQRVGIDPTELNDAEKLTHWEISAGAWDHALDMTGDPLLALHMGEDPNFAGLGMLGYLMQSCSTLEEALTVLVKYNNTVSTIFTFSTESHGTEYYFYYEPVPTYRNKYPESCRQAVELMMASITTGFRVFADKKVSPLRAELAYPRRSPQEYERVLQTRVVFGADRNSLVYRQEDIAAPTITYDKSLYSFFNLLLTEKQNALAVQKSLADEIKEVLLSQFGGQVPPIEVVAAHLNMSLRTFQRRLSEEKVTYRQVSSELRKELALSLMSNRQSRKAEVAQLLGYADLSSFQRAYRNWTQPSA
ncbi:AraC family transcriptional regulator [Telluribacter sp. SYSU D00476]|uniref:AraC family transcriptional regulator n=1 Tax=Telluribacter sp. SYSU D00476 TaxID=2811430 RepID=UPI001FF2A282|nr:AraC family transcriptional regulator [Telluribacter sp. SYSU D00476]